MKIVISSIFRNSTPYIGRYLEQVGKLRSALELRGDHTELVLLEGDSTDGSFKQLQAMTADLPGVTLLKLDHGGPVFGSVDDATRWRNISRVCNYLLNNVPHCDVFVYIESDLIWDEQTLVALVDDIGKYDAVAPMCFHLPTGRFYDIWGHRRNGVKFTPGSPYHPDLDRRIFPEDRLEIDSAGSCIVMRGDVAALARFTPPELGIVGFCNDMRSWGFSLYLNPNLRVYHP